MSQRLKRCSCGYYWVYIGTLQFRAVFVTLNLTHITGQVGIKAIHLGVCKISTVTNLAGQEELIFLADNPPRNLYASQQNLKRVDIALSLGQQTIKEKENPK